MSTPVTVNYDMILTFELDLSFEVNQLVIYLGQVTLPGYNAQAHTHTHQTNCSI